MKITIEVIYDDEKDRNTVKIKSNLAGKDMTLGNATIEELKKFISDYFADHLYGQ